MTEHLVDGKYYPKRVSIGDLLKVYSRNKKPVVAKLDGTKREFINLCDVERAGSSNQITVYTFQIDEPGTYEIDGDEFGPYHHNIRVQVL